MSRPVQAIITVPVETALGLSNEPAWLDGYGWLDAPTSRLLLPDAELRQLSIDGPTGQVLDLAARDVRPPPTPTGVRHALLDLTTHPVEASDIGWRTEPEHDPSQPLTDLVHAARPHLRRPDPTPQPRPHLRPRPQPTPPARTDRRLEPHRPQPPHPPAQALRLDPHPHRHRHHLDQPRRPGRRHPPPPPTHPRHRPRPHPPPATLPDPDQLAAIDTDQLTPTTDRPPVLPPPQRTATPARPATTAADDAPPF